MNSLKLIAVLLIIGGAVGLAYGSFSYTQPKTVDDIINHTVGRLLDLFGIETKAVRRWQGGPPQD